VQFILIVAEQSSAGSIPGYPLYEDSMLPVFTSPESFASGLKACASASPEYDSLGFELTDPFELSEMLSSCEERGLRSLLFDPPPAPDGELWIVGTPIPVGEYRDAIEELRPGFEKLSAEAVDEFRRLSHLAGEPFVRWPAARAEDIAADLRARIEELIDCAGS
jgi:hypothetical protein